MEGKTHGSRVVDHISWVQKVEPDCKPSKPSPFCIFLHSMVLSLKGSISFPTRNRVCRDLSLLWYISHSNHHRFPSISDISLKPCCTVTMPFKTASFSSSSSTVYLCFGPNSSSCPSWISLADGPAWLVNHSFHV